MPINGLQGFGGGNGGILSGGAKDSTYSISVSTTSIDEGGQVVFSVITTYVPDGTTLYWTINQVSGTISNSDFTSGNQSGSFTVNNNFSNIVINIANDLLTEGGSDIFNLEIRSGSISGTVLVTSANVTINDTSTNVYEALYSTAGTFSFVAPALAAASNVHCVCVGGGGGGDGAGGGGGGLAYKNNIPVNSGSSYTVQVGAAGPGAGNGGDSYFVSTGEVRAYGGYGASGSSSGSGRSYAAGNGGGSGGNGSPGPSWGGGGGGAGGYTGNGGHAGNQSGSAGSGGGGGGGASNGPLDPPGLMRRKGGGGGGVGLYGQGPNGAGAPYDPIGGYSGNGGSFYDASSYGIPSYDSGGRGGTDGQVHMGGPGGNFGGGGGGANSTGYGGNGAKGGVRIIWGPGRSFPNTSTGYI